MSHSWILKFTSEESLLMLLLHPPQLLLPATPEVFLMLTFSVKLKDDDMGRDPKTLEVIEAVRCRIRWKAAFTTELAETREDTEGGQQNYRALYVTQVIIGHIPHLHQIKKANSPVYPYCHKHEETAAHFILHCPIHWTA